MTGVRTRAVPGSSGPTVLRMLVGAQLRRHREAAGITPAQAGYHIRGSHSKISRMELGRVSFKERDVADLLTLYGVTEPERREPLLQLAEQANRPGWWHPYAAVIPSWFEPYLGLEQGAAVIRTHDIQHVPGLLQAPGYAAAVIRARHHGIAREDVERRVELVLRRQEILHRPDPVRLWAVIDEAVLRRMIGGSAAMREQLEHLAAIVEAPNVTVQVMPLAAGGQALVQGPVTLLRFAERELPDVIYLEHLAGGSYPDRQLEVTRYRDVLNRLGVQARPPTETPDILRGIIRNL
ncbi:helix-turn-helix domain-containing protein [Actinomadura kijaniata]|uniref:helix-turn-helix domain-containing protein n=1 Tax=Actinomadura kijaniata TaxID=46161 RepID=UPI003F1E0CA2